MITCAQLRNMAVDNASSTLPKFTGYNDVAPAVWLEKYAIFANSKGWNPQQTLDNVGLYLGDGPYTWYRQLPNATKRNLALLQAAFDAKYMQHASLQWALRAQLVERKQLPHETVEDYAQDIEKRCGQLQINGQQLLENFVRGLTPTLQAAVIKDQPTNITKAINSARVAQSLEMPTLTANDMTKTIKAALTEQLETMKKELASLTINSMNPTTTNQQQQRQWGGLNHRQQPALEPNQHTQHQQCCQQYQQPPPDFQRPWSLPHQQQQCYRCSRSDHVPFQCLAINVSCHYCGKMGHLIRMCKQRHANYHWHSQPKSVLPPKKFRKTHLIGSKIIP